MTKSIKTLDDMRDELRRLPGRMPGRTTLSAICKEGGSNTVVSFVMRPLRNRDVNMSSLWPVFAVTGHELVASRPDMAEMSVRSDDDLRALFRGLSAHTGKSLSAMSNDAGISLTLVTFLSETSGRKTCQLSPVLKLLNSEKVALRIRKIQPSKRATPKGS